MWPGSAPAPRSAPDLLRAAAPGYCTSQQQAEAPDNWFEQALAYATDKLHGAAAALSPAGAGMGQLAGYTVADYLIQHASRERRYARLPASTWDAVLSYVRDPADAARLADSAREPAAVPLRHPAVPARRRRRRRARRAGGWPSCWPGAVTWTRLRARADAGDEHAAERLADCSGAATWTSCAPGPTPRLPRRPGLAELLGARRPGRAARPGRRRRPDRRPAAGRAARGARRPGRGRPDAARRGRRRRRVRRLGAGQAACASAATWTGCAICPRPTPATGTPPGGWPSCSRSAATWTGPRRYCAPGPTPATSTPPRLAELLVRRGDLDGLRARADAGDEDAAWALAGLLAERGDLDGAAQILRAAADAGDEHAARRLAGLL